MKNALKFALVLFAGILLFAGCSDGSGSDYSGGNKTISGLKFNLSSAAIASAKSSDSSMRAVESGENAIVGIEKNGATKQIILSNYASSLPPVSQFIKQTGSDGKEYLYIIFEWDWYLNTGNKGGEDLGRVICVSPDGSCAKVIDDNYEFNNSYGNSTLQFDGYGNAYYCAAVYSGSSTTSVIFKYNPVQQTNTRLTAPVDGRYYTNIQVTSNGEWLFAEGNQYGSGSSFFRAIPVADPGNFDDLRTTYSGWICYGNDIYLRDWESVYRIQKKDGKYLPDNIETIFGRGSGSWNSYADNVFSHTSDSQYFLNEEYTSWSYTYNKKFYLADENGNPNLSELQNAFLWELGDDTISSDTDKETLELLAAKYDFRFDKFAEIKGLQSLAKITQGKKNEDAFAAIFSSEDHKQLFATMFSYRSPYSSTQPTSRYGYDDSISGYRYKYNFFADITYLKNTDILLADSDDCAHIQRLEKKGNTNYYQDNGRFDIFHAEPVYLAKWQSDYQNADGSVNAAKVLKGFFSLCNVTGDKEFRLDVFKNDDDYVELYSSATDEQAIEFISQTPEKLGLFCRYITAGSNWQFSLEKVAEICFIKGTDTPAYNEQNSSSSLDYKQISDFMIKNGYLYAIANSDTLIKFDADGNIVEVKTFDISFYDGSYYGNVKIFGNKIYTKQGNKLYMINIDTGVITDLFQKVPEAGNSNFMLLTFEGAESDVYFSAEYGLDVINKVINIDTGTVTNIDSTLKFTNILSLF